MYIGIKGGIIDFKTDKTTAIGKGSDSWPDNRKSFDVVKKYGENQYNIAGLVGYFFRSFNFEIEGGISVLDFATADYDDLQKYTLYRVNPIYGMLNAYVNLQNFTPVSPYFGAGIGMMKAYYDISENQTPEKHKNKKLLLLIDNTEISNFIKIFEEKISANQVIFQISTGVNVAFTRSLTIAFDYRTFNKFSDLKFEKEANKSVYITNPYKHTTIGASARIRI